jgi:hypothetical protein
VNNMKRNEGRKYIKTSQINTVTAKQITNFLC